MLQTRHYCLSRSILVVAWDVSQELWLYPTRGVVTPYMCCGYTPHVLLLYPTCVAVIPHLRCGYGGPMTSTIML